ncbi:MAG TPA: hypothetical protein VH165_15570 [Kofleriaceae bacterium]|nr:hypothetical protein [Kofleriaceae bacterium]
MRAWALVLLLGGCSFQATPAGTGPAGGSSNGAPADAEVDAPLLDGKDPPICKGNFVNICVDPPQNAVTLNQSLDTGTSPLCAGSKTTPATDACVIAGTSISLPSGTTVTVTGSRKLILFSTSTITISGTLDVASHRGKAGGPAADMGPCPTTGFTNPSPPQGGGFGGSFGTAGGNGGNGAAGGVGGMAAPSFTPTVLQAGCPGADGQGQNGDRGRGGGAVLLYAETTITIDGTLNASGASGDGGSLGGAGGGGGAGGMIVLDAASVKTPGKCFANGGGGGGGGVDIISGRSGNESTAPGSKAGGGSGGVVVGKQPGNGGNGGDGAYSTTQATSATSGGGTGFSSGGGGGGAGGAGVIKVIASETDSVDDSSHVSPPAAVSQPPS